MVGLGKIVGALVGCLTAQGWNDLKKLFKNIIVVVTKEQCKLIIHLQFNGFVK